jgi:tetratricopeptide (TPR) repeat protein
LEGAGTSYEVAVTLKPDFTEAWYNWGNALQKREKFTEAVGCYDKALGEKPDFAEAHYNRAMALRKLKRYEEALTGYDQAIALKPEYTEAYFGRGNVLAELKRPFDAINDYNQALSLRPDYAEAYLGRATVLQELKRFDEALDCYSQALALHPNNVDIHLGRAAVLQESKKFDEALACYDQALSLDPDNADIYLQYGDALQRLGKSATDITDDDRNIAIYPRLASCLKMGTIIKKSSLWEAALSCYNLAAALSPTNAHIFLQCGSILTEMKRFDEALGNFEQGIALDSSTAELYFMRGHALQSIGQFEAALADYDQAISLKPDYAEAFTNRGAVFAFLGQRDEAIRDYKHAIAIAPLNPVTIWNKSLHLLLTGQFTEGWELYEWRWQREDFTSPRRNFSQPLWLGQETLTNRTILLHSEQGLGDTIQFCRYVPLAARLGARVILEVEEVLVPLLKNLDGIEKIIPKGNDLPDFDCHCPLMSLPLAFKTELHTIPTSPSYLKAPPDKIVYWQNKLGEKTKPRAGLVWSGKKTYANDHNRSIILKEWISHLPAGYQYVSLQKDPREEDEKTLQEHGEILRCDHDIHDFSDTAALCALMDVVISVDTSCPFKRRTGKTDLDFIAFHPFRLALASGQKGQPLVSQRHPLPPASTWRLGRCF